jgi:RNA polymerase-binding transcription factor DksA
MKDKNEHKNLIEQELEQVRQQIAALKRATASKPDYGLGQGDPAITRWEMDRALLQRLQEREATLTRAIDGNDEGYGVCVKCGNPIHPDRLAVLPDTEICINCARSDVA